MDQSPAGTGVEDRPTEERRVVWVELFFDLTWVFAIIQLSATLATAHSPGEAARTLLLFAPLWWGWVGTTLLANLAGAAVDRAAGRLLLFAVAGCGLLVSIAIDDAYGDQGLVFAAGYAALRLLLWLTRQRLPRPQGISQFDPFAVGLFVGAPLFLLGAMLPGPARTVAWAVGAAVEMASPRLLRPRLRQLRFETTHLPERFGLFLIIALGETVLAVGGQAAGLHLDGTGYLTLAVAFVLIVLLWWTYFHYGADAVRHGLATSQAQTRIVTDVFSYAHFVYAVAVILVAVGLKKLLAHPLDHPHSLPELLLAPGIALYLAGFCYARWRMFGAATWHRTLGAAAFVGLSALAPYLPALVTAALAVLGLLAVNGYESWTITTGRGIPLVRLRRG